MTTPDYPKALAAAREALAKYEARDARHYIDEALRDLLAAIDAARGDVRQKVKDTLTDYLDHYPHPELLDAVMAQFVTAAPPAAAVPEGGLRDSVLNSAKFRASCYALVGIVEGIEGLGRNWAANGERLKDTPEWVAFYNCVASMRNGTFNQASAEQAQQPAAAVPEVPAFTTGHCDYHKQAGGCPLHNLSCGWPKCDRRPNEAHRAMLAAARKGVGVSHEN